MSQYFLFQRHTFQDRSKCTEFLLIDHYFPSLNICAFEALRDAANIQLTVISLIILPLKVIISCFEIMNKNINERHDG